MLRVLVVDDSPLFAEAVTELLQGEPSLLVVGVASNGREAVDMCASLQPNLLIMDIHMPVMDGLQAIEHIMANQPTPILVMTSDPNLGDSHYEALRRGALDVVPKPTYLGGGRERQLLLDRVRLLAVTPVVRHPYGRRRLWRPVTTPPPITRPYPVTRPDRQVPLARTPTPPLPRLPTPSGEPVKARCSSTVVGIAASTGGPAALAHLLEALPAALPAAILVVQHIAPGFMASLTSWLGRVSRLSVRVGIDGGAVEPGTITFAPDDHHMTVDACRKCLRIDSDPPVGGHRPSGNRLLASVAAACGSHSIGVVLSGMGDDGVAGLAAIRDAGGLTLAQDERSSVVFGMPGEAVRSGAASRAMSVDQIAEVICTRVRSARELR